MQDILNCKTILLILYFILSKCNFMQIQQSPSSTVLVSEGLNLCMLFGLVNICIVEKITKFDNDIFLDFRAAG